MIPVAVIGDPILNTDNDGREDWNCVRTKVILTPRKAFFSTEAGSMSNFTETRHCQIWLSTISQFVVSILAVVFGIAQFATLIDKPLFCANVSSFDIPSVDEVNELKEKNPCLAPPGVYTPGDSLGNIIGSDRDFATVIVE